MKQCKNFRLYKGLRQRTDEAKKVKILMGAEYAAAAKADRAAAIAPETGRRYSMPAVLGAPYKIDVSAPNIRDARRGLWGYAQALEGDEGKPICETCHLPIEGTYASIGGSFVPEIAPKFYHVHHVPTVKAVDPYEDFSRRAWLRNSTKKDEELIRRVRKASSDFVYGVYKWRGMSPQFMQVQVSRLMNLMMEALKGEDHAE